MIKEEKKLSELLEGYGVRINYSVFEANLNKKDLVFLKKEIKKIVLRSDSVRFYHICSNCINKSFEVCEREDIFESNGFV